MVAQIVDQNGEELEGADFNELVRPQGVASDAIASLTGITNEKVALADNIEVVGRDFMEFIDEQLDYDCLLNAHDEEDNGELVNGRIIILVTHNRNRFDTPFLLSKLPVHVVSLYKLIK